MIMKKIIFSLFLSFLISAVGMTAYAQNQSASGNPDALALNVYVDSAPNDCPTSGTVNGTISASSGTWWPANPANYSGPGYYYLFVPNANTNCGTGHASVMTVEQHQGLGTVYCHGSGLDYFAFPNNPLDAIHFDLTLEYDPDSEQ